MKRILTLFLLFLFLLNVLGYYGIFVGLEKSLEQKIQSKFDEEGFRSDDEIMIKFPLSVPYVSDSREFSRVDGEFEHQGEIYRLVKQRYTSDTLYIVCVKDEASKEIKQALTEFVKSFSDNHTSEKSQSKSAQNLTKDYISTATDLQSLDLGWSYSVSSGNPVEVLYSWTSQSTSPPPKA